MFALWTEMEIIETIQEASSTSFLDIYLRVTLTGYTNPDSIIQIINFFNY